MAQSAGKLVLVNERLAQRHDFKKYPYVRLANFNSNYTVTFKPLHLCFKSTYSTLFVLLTITQ